jgi:hypothetical protein
MRLGRRARFPDVGITIVDAPVISKLAGGIEHGSFGRDGSFGPPHERMVRIAQRSARQPVLRNVLTNSVARFTRIGIDYPELYATASKLGRDAL